MVRDAIAKICSQFSDVRREIPEISSLYYTLLDSCKRVTSKAESTCKRNTGQSMTNPGNIHMSCIRLWQRMAGLG